MSLDVSVTVFAALNDKPPSKSSTVSPATANEPLVGSVARNIVELDSALLSNPSDNFVDPCSVNVGAAGDVVSTTSVPAGFVKAPDVIATLPAESFSIVRVLILLLVAATVAGGVYFAVFQERGPRPRHQPELASVFHDPARTHSVGSHKSRWSEGRFCRCVEARTRRGQIGRAHV